MKNYDNIKTLADKIISNFNRSSDLVVLYTPFFQDYINSLPIESNFSMAELDGFYCENECEISIRVQNNKKVVFCGPLPYYNDLADLQKFTDGIRLLKLLNFNNLFFLTEATGMEQSVDLNQPMIISDHINLTTFNPLIGSNDERFGVRFPDMSEAYDRNQVKKYAENIRNAGLDDNRVIAAVVTKKMNFDNDLTISKSGASVIVHAIAAEVITAVHCGLTCCALAFCCNVDDNNSKQLIYNKLNALNCWN